MEALAEEVVLSSKGCEEERSQSGGRSTLTKLAKDKVLLIFFACAFLFHFANAAMLPQLGELLALGSPQAAAPFMSGRIAITQTVMLCTAAFFGRLANRKGRRDLLLIGFGMLPLRAVLYTLLHTKSALLGVQILDGLANSILVSSRSWSSRIALRALAVST